jgi:hypothetical protein
MDTQDAVLVPDLKILKITMVWGRGYACTNTSKFGVMALMDGSHRPELEARSFPAD